MMCAPMPLKTVAARSFANCRYSLRIAARLSTRTVAVGPSSAPAADVRDDTAPAVGGDDVRFVQGEGTRKSELPRGDCVASAFDVAVRIATTATAIPVTPRLLVAMTFPPADDAGGAGTVECGDEGARCADCEKPPRNRHGQGPECPSAHLESPPVHPPAASL